MKSELNLAFSRGEKLMPFTTETVFENQQYGAQFIQYYAAGVAHTKGVGPALDWASSLQDPEQSQNALNQIFKESTASPEKISSLNTVLDNLDQPTAQRYRQSLIQWLDGFKGTNDLKRDQLRIALKL